MHPIALLALLLILARWVGQLGLEWLNRRHVRAHADHVPAVFAGIIDDATYGKAVAYTLAKNRLGVMEATLSTGVLIAVLWSGLLPWAWDEWTRAAGHASWAAAAGLFLLGVIVAIPGLPLDWWSQFRLEARFGFNTTTPATWCLDRLKALLLGAVVGIPLLTLLLAWAGWAGRLWWLWAAATVIGFQALMLVVAPVLILPLFNKFQPLRVGPLRERLLALADRTGFRTRGIEVMDGSRRSHHANAFFTGLGRFRKIVLFDTLMNQLGDEEIEAVLAHEIGHFRRHHVPKLLAGSVVMTLVGFAVLGWLAEQPWFFQAFGFQAASIPVALLLFVLLSDAVGFWAAPLMHALSRWYEYEADAYARGVLGRAEPMISALRKLHTKNLANLTPHPLYSRFHYSHPTLLEREQALHVLG